MGIEAVYTPALAKPVVDGRCSIPTNTCTRQRRGVFLDSDWTAPIRAEVLSIARTLSGEGNICR